MADPAIHLVPFSTGAGSAEVAWRVVAQYGAAAVVLLTADTKVEDGDNWRFGEAVASRLGCEWVRLADGRTPMQVGRDERVVPNNRMAVCSKILKRQLMRRYIDDRFDPAGTTVYLGYDWTEPHRMTAAVPHWAPYTVAAPLMDAPILGKHALLDLWRDRGIEPPRLYAQGFHHANCGGACVRGGQAQWELLLRTHRDRYLTWEAEEATTRQLLGKDVTILRDRRDGSTTPLTLRTFRERIEQADCDQPGLFDADDWGACGCMDAAS